MFYQAVVLQPPYLYAYPAFSNERCNERSALSSRNGVDQNDAVMDPNSQIASQIEFLDLSDVDVYQRNWIMSILHRPNPKVELAWETPSVQNQVLEEPHAMVPDMNATGYHFGGHQQPMYHVPQPCYVTSGPSLVCLSPMHAAPVVLVPQPTPIPHAYLMGTQPHMSPYVSPTYEPIIPDPEIIPSPLVNGIPEPIPEPSDQQQYGINGHADHIYEENDTLTVTTETYPPLPPVSSEQTDKPVKSWASILKNDPKPTTNTDHSHPPQTNHKPTPPKTLVPNNNVSSPAQIAKRISSLKEPLKSNADDPSLYRIGEIVAKYTVDNRSISLQPRGLVNKSNYCYIHSILQALLACPPVYNLLSTLAKNECPASTQKKCVIPITDGMIRFVKQFHNLPAGTRINRRSGGGANKNQKQELQVSVNCEAPFEPTWMSKLLNGTRKDTFVVEGRQEDAEEFLGCLLNGLNDEMLELMKLVGASATFDGDVLPSSDDWQVIGPKNRGCVTRRIEIGRTPITDIFGGLLRSRIHRSGDQPTDNIQPFFTLQLHTEKSGDVKEALEHLVCKNQLEGLTSPKTNEKVEAYEQVTIEELPLVLVLHVKCFNFKANGCTKVMKPLEFPIDLKIESKMLSSKMMGSKDRNYKLCAAIYHEGKEVTKGHYLTDAYHTGYSCWLRYDDASVTVVPEEYVLKPVGTRVPYLLFYRRSDSINKK